MPDGRWISTAAKLVRSVVGAVSAIVMLDATAPPVPVNACVQNVSPLAERNWLTIV